MDSNRKKRIVVNPYAKKKRKRPVENERELPSISVSSSWLSPSISHLATNMGNDVRSASKPVSNFNFNSKNTDSDINNNVSAQASALIISAADKAGMEGIDRSKINAIILRESGNSLYMQQQRRRDEKVNERVRQLQQRLQEASPRDYRATEELDETLRDYQRQQKIRATCVVVDMVSFHSIRRTERATGLDREIMNESLINAFFPLSNRICFTWPVSY